jgi:hypothetical protein
LSPTAQNEADPHEIEVAPSVFGPSMLVGALHELPLKITTLPSWCTAAQNDEDGHETLERCSDPSMSTRGLQDVPS